MGSLSALRLASQLNYPRRRLYHAMERRGLPAIGHDSGHEPENERQQREGSADDQWRHRRPGHDRDQTERRQRCERGPDGEQRQDQSDGAEYFTPAKEAQGLPWEWRLRSQNRRGG